EGSDAQGEGRRRGGAGPPALTLPSHRFGTGSLRRPRSFLTRICADLRGWARIVPGSRVASPPSLWFAGACCGAFPGGLLAWRVAPLAFLAVRRRLRCRGVLPALRARFLVSVECRALGHGGLQPRWRRCGGPSSGTP